jgi:hypothetical protein
MGLLDLIEKTVEKTVEGVSSIPAVPFRIGKGVVDGVDKGIENISKVLDDIFED